MFDAHTLLIQVLLSLIDAEATTGRNSSFFQALAFDHELGATRGIDAVLKAHKLDSLVLPATGWTTTPAGTWIPGPLAQSVAI